MIDQLSKQHENLTWNTLFNTTIPSLEVEKGTTVSVSRGNGKWLDTPVKVICIRLKTPYFDAQFTLCDKEAGWDHLVNVVEGKDWEHARAEALASKVFFYFSAKETLLMMHESYRYGVNHGKDLLRSDIKRLLHI